MNENWAGFSGKPPQDSSSEDSGHADFFSFGPSPGHFTSREERASCQAACLMHIGSNAYDAPDHLTRKGPHGATWWGQEWWWVWWNCHAELQWGGLLWGMILLDDLSAVHVVPRAFFFPRTHVQVVGKIKDCTDQLLLAYGVTSLERCWGWKWGSREQEGWLSENLHVWWGGKKEEVETVAGISFTRSVTRIGFSPQIHVWP